VRLIRVFVDAPLAPGAQVTLDGSAAAHVSRVLRLKAGDGVTLFNGDGSDYPAKIAAIGRATVAAAVGARTAARVESPLSVTLVQGIARGDRMDLVIQKATELGVAAILPVVTARSVVKLDPGTLDRKRAHWQAIAVAACEQCGRAKLPLIAAPRALAEVLAGKPGGGARLLLAPDAQLSLGAAARGETAVEILVGPEGGLEEAERRAALDAGFRACRLGPRVLRSETAAIAALAVLQSVAGDLG
jgi:16S rRNA (uracil1498-N3)-methyltransferase